MNINPNQLTGYMREAAEKQAVKRAPVKARRGVMNKWEESFSQVLAAAMKAGNISDWRFENIKLKIGVGAWFTPDFAVADKDIFSTFYEVKGHRTAASIVRLKAAALFYPKYRFILVTGAGGGWEYTPIGGDMS